MNYHFGGKEELYRRVIRRIEEDAASLLPEPGVVSGTAGERLRGLIGHLVGAMLGREQPLWERVLMARELAEPTPAFDALIEASGRPLHEGIGVLVAEITDATRECRGGPGDVQHCGPVPVPPAARAAAQAAPRPCCGPGAGGSPITSHRLAVATGLRPDGASRRGRVGARDGMG